MRAVRTTIVLAGLLAAPLIAAPRPRPATGVTVVTSGTEPALGFGKTVIARPFGADLVDRIAIVGGYRLRNETLYLIRGEAGTTCAARYMIASVRGRAAPVLTPAFGTCMPGAGAQLAGGTMIVTMPAAVAGEPAARFVYANGAIRPVAGTGATMLMQATTCADVLPDAGGNLSAQLDELLPEAAARGSAVRRTAYAPEELRGLVVDLACLATLPNGHIAVPKRATELFASRRHGEAAYAALDEVARTPAAAPDLRAAVRAFSAHMHYYVRRRTVI